MIEKLTEWAIRNPLITIVVFLSIAGASIFAIYETPIDALPDLSENQVIVMTPWPGQTPANVENQITYPMSVGMQGLAGVRTVRAMSQLGLSMVTVIFDDSVDEYFARDRVNERLSTISADLPDGVKPVIGPDATGLGQIFMYTLDSDGRILTELRSLQDFTIKLALQSVPGVAEVASIGGYKQTYQVVIDPTALEKYDISLREVMSAIASANNDVSGRVLESNGQEIAIAWDGFVGTKEDLENLFLRTVGSVPVTIRDIASVQIGSAFRRGILADDTGERVGGIVVMRYGENPLAVISAVKARITEIEKTLPDGISIKPFYDRTDLIRGAVDTLSDILVSELVITILVLIVFLWHFGASLVTAITLISGLGISFLLMWMFGIPSNIMSLGGVAVAVGTMVDAAIVVVENVYNRFLIFRPKSLSERLSVVITSTREVAGSLVFAILIIILSFAPILALQGQEGKLFAPLAYTNGFAMFGALFAALFLAPILCLFFLRGRLRTDREILTVRLLQAIYRPLLLGALRYRKTVLAISVISLAVGGWVFTQIGSEFMPPLDEWSIMYMPMTVPDVSERRARDLLIETHRIIMRTPEVEQVVGKAWRAATATDPAPLAMFESIITLKPRSEWRPGITKDDIVNEMNRAIRIEWLWNGFTQPIIGRIDMLSTGIRAQVGVKIYGDDPMKLETLAIETEKLLGNVPGGFGVTAIRTAGLRYLHADIDEETLRDYGVRKGDVLDVIAMGVGGMTASTTVQWRERYAIEIRLNQDYREDVDTIRNLSVPSSGWAIRLDQVATISIEEWPSVINSENAVMRSAVQMNVRGIDLATFVQWARAYLDQHLDLPAGYRVEWTGQYENQIRAQKTLSVIVPIVVVVILFLLFIAYRDAGLVAIVSLAIPFGLIGWVIALYWSGFNFSVAVWVGFISLFGNAVETGVVMILYLENAFREQFWFKGESNIEKINEKREISITVEGIHEAVMHGAMTRLRPVLMTAFTSILGLLPMIWSIGVGAELQKPLAIVVVGGLVTAILLTLFILPILFSYLRERKVS